MNYKRGIRVRCWWWRTKRAVREALLALLAK